MSELTVAKQVAASDVCRSSGHGASGTVDVLLICHSGGHLVQLASLRRAWDAYSTAWVTDDSSDARSLLRGERVYYGFGPAARSGVNFVRNLRLARGLLADLRPKLVVSTGAAMCVPFFWVARLRGIEAIYIESVTRIHSPSLACRLVRPVATRTYVQWPELAERVRGSIYVGSVLPGR
jgi:UDP-N-acetylglucosamine:LPS N-acetylglucosamine transferase